LAPVGATSAVSRRLKSRACFFMTPCGARLATYRYRSGDNRYGSWRMLNRSIAAFSAVALSGAWSKPTNAAGVALEADHFPLGFTLTLSHSGNITGSRYVSESTLFVPQIAASEHCGVCRTGPEPSAGTSFVRLLMGRRDPSPHPPMHLGSRASN
jgi:hypothetical protein